MMENVHPIFQEIFNTLTPEPKDKILVSPYLKRALEVVAEIKGKSVESLIEEMLFIYNKK